MAKKKEYELRMYFLCMYNLSPIQQGIQALHAVIEYFLKHWKDKEFWRWARTHKTVILLNGGTSNNGTKSEYGYKKQLGTMEQHFKSLKDNKIKCAAFYEPDLNYAMSSIAFLVDERVFNKKDYPDFEYTLAEFKKLNNAGYHAGFVPINDTTIAFEKSKERRKVEYIKKVGKEVAFLKDFLKQFRLA